MKRISFYAIVIIQILLLLFLSFQFERVDQQGETVKVKTAKPDYEIYGGGIYDGTMHVEYEINKVPEEKWKSTTTVDYNNKVYVLLEKNEDGILDVVEASHDPIKEVNEHQIVLQAFYHYHDTEQHFYYVRYGLEEIEHIEKYGSYRADEQLIVTAKIGKWGQRMITNVEKYDH